jgi:UDP-N-acetylglucosamine 2-epimerase
MNFVSIVGARPEFVQVAVLSRALRARHRETLVHTGQHYDAGMSGRFFADLEIAPPEIELGVGSLPPSAQVGEIMHRLAEALGPLDPDAVIVRGDTNSTLAGALVAKQLLLPLVHVEAGMRSYDRTAPEEINRLAVDHIADLALTTDEAAAHRLRAEGVAEDAIVVCGDVMFDLFLHVQPGAAAALGPDLAARVAEPFVLLTLHRSENVDDPQRLRAILAGFETAGVPVIFPLHPRTAERLREFGLEPPAGVVVCEPLGYAEMVALESRARTIFTDSGGVQREAYFAGVPCVTLRDATEWTNTIEAGWNRLVGASTTQIAALLDAPPGAPAERPPLFGDGRAAQHIVAALEAPKLRELVAFYRATREARGAGTGARSGASMR